MALKRSRPARLIAGIAAATLLGSGGALIAATPAVAAPVVVYDSQPAVPAPTYFSVAFQATQTSQFGDLVVLGGTDRTISEITVNFVSWACETGAWQNNNCVTTPGLTYTHPITLNIYAVDRSGAEVAAGSLLFTTTVPQTIPYRPSASPECTGASAGRWFHAPSGVCYNGIAADVTFSGLNFVADDEIIVGIAYNTQNHGPTPTGVPGPYDTLNVSLAPGAPSVGTDDVPDQMFRQTLFNGGDNTWRVTSGWGTGSTGLLMTIVAESEDAPAPSPSPSQPELAATGTSEAISGLVVGGVMLLLGGVIASLVVRRRRAVDAAGSV